MSEKERIATLAKERKIKTVYHQGAMIHMDWQAKSFNILLETMEKKKQWKIPKGIFFKMSPNQSKAKGVMKSKSHRPTVDDVHQWARSLDKLLAHKYGKAVYCVFLKSEFCEENIEFWTACEDFKTSKSKWEMAFKAKHIAEEFVKSNAPKEINLDYATKNGILQSLAEPSGSTFVAAQRKVYSLMENNSYPRFLLSDLYRDLLLDVKTQGKRN
ncbi:regulator of G-protein signaling 2 [Gadus chalcogrammus]|nr:regulator of G-protein signaling 2 [Gadus chalcogrammus]